MMGGSCDVVCPTCASIADLKMQIQREHCFERGLTLRLFICQGVEAGTDVGQYVAIPATAASAVAANDPSMELPDSLLVDELSAEVELQLLIDDGILVLEDRLAKLQSPHCRYQKYLRWLEGVEAGDKRVLRTVWSLVALEPPELNPKETDAADSGIQQLQEHVYVDEVSAAVVMSWECIWWSHRNGWRARSPAAATTGATGDLRRGVKVDESLASQMLHWVWEDFECALTPFIRPENYKRLLGWLICDVAPGGTSPRLRVALAEVDQIMCRGCRSFVEESPGPNDRQNQSFIHLGEIAHCTKRVRCWA
eukprot:TRINITY_DN19827_c0_g1_i2.p1 TRINITY_DN19827_c0_g1~~TRINITY_DN19827_c0_g1_i2.p1  ORF type:complete len:326 (+),score=48.95 TRINITY_DN19827_c0_g1_i2:54-980(+)